MDKAPPGLIRGVSRAGPYASRRCTTSPHNATARSSGPGGCDRARAGAAQSATTSQRDDLGRTTPRQRQPGAAMAVAVDDVAVALDPRAAAPARAQAGACPQHRAALELGHEPRAAR